MTDDPIRIVYRHIKENSTTAASRTVLERISAYSASVQSLFDAYCHYQQKYRLLQQEYQKRGKISEQKQWSCKTSEYKDKKILTGRSFNAIGLIGAWNIVKRAYLSTT